MNPNVKGSVIGVGAGVATYVGDIVQWLLEMGVGDMPDKVDGAVTGLTVAVVSFLIYRFLPTATPSP